MKVGVIGASGYVGGEIIRLLLSHPKVDVNIVTSRQHVGNYLHRIHPSLKSFTDLIFSELDYSKISDKCDLVFTAVPHGNALEIVKNLYDLGIKVIDLSADYRLHNSMDYEKWYKFKHPYPKYLSKSVFGIPEIHKNEIKNANLVSCPGCMAVTSILALYPLVKNNIIDREHIVVDSKIGSSGAGANVVFATQHAMRAGVIRPYKPANHRHTGEIQQELDEIAKTHVNVSMSPHAVDIVRGILCTSHTFLIKDIVEKDLWKIYRNEFQNEKFIRLIRDKKGFYKYPDPKFVVGSNFCDIGFDIDYDNKRCIALSASDNLMKGAAGSAIQNMNIMSNFNESDGISYSPLTPV